MAVLVLRQGKGGITTVCQRSKGANSDPIQSEYEAQEQGQGLISHVIQHT